MLSFSNNYDMNVHTGVNYPTWIKSEKYFNCENFYQTFILGKLREKIAKRVK